MPQALPISRLINVGVTIAPKAAQNQNLNSALLLGVSDVIDTLERYRTYATIDAVAADFTTAAPEYLAALLWFSQSPQPSSLLIGRWANAATKGGLRGGALTAAQQALANFTGIANGTFSLTKDGGAPVNVTGLNFTAVTSMNDVAAVIQAAAAMVATTVVWNSVYNRIEIKSNTVGAASSIAFLGLAGSGTDISVLLKLNAAGGGYVWSGQALETAAAAVALFDAQYGQAWYGLFALSIVNADVLAIAAYIEAANNKHMFAVNTQDANVLVAAATTDIAYQLKALGYKRTFTQYSSSSLYSVVSALARQLSVDYTGSNTTLTLMFKQEPGIAAEALNATQIAALEGKNCNVFVAYNNNTSIFEPALTASGLFIDIIAGTDWLATDIQTAVYNALYTNTTKIPQTDDGMHMLKTVIESRCAQALINGLLGPGTWTDGGFGLMKTGDFLPNGFYVYAPAVASQSVADRQARKSVPFQVAAKLAGAVHSVAITVNVNQ